MSVPFPSPTIAIPSGSEVFIGYLDYFRSRVLAKVTSLPEAERRRRRLPSGWTPLELLRHLRYVELRWLEWGFDGRDIGNPWADSRDGRWRVDPGESLEQLAAELTAQAISGSPASGGTEPSRRRWNGCCCTLSRSTPPGTSASSMSSPSWPTARSASSRDHRDRITSGLAFANCNHGFRRGLPWLGGATCAFAGVSCAPHLRAPDAKVALCNKSARASLSPLSTFHRFRSRKTGEKGLRRLRNR